MWSLCYARNHKIYIVQSCNTKLVAINSEADSIHFLFYRWIFTFGILQTEISYVKPRIAITRAHTYINMYVWTHVYVCALACLRCRPYLGLIWSYRRLGSHYVIIVKIVGKNRWHAKSHKERPNSRKAARLLDLARFGLVRPKRAQRAQPEISVGTAAGFYMATSKSSHMTKASTSCYTDDVLDSCKSWTSVLSRSVGGSIDHVAYLKVSMFVRYPSNVNWPSHNRWRRSTHSK